MQEQPAMDEVRNSAGCTVAAEPFHTGSAAARVYRRDAALKPQPKRDGADFWPTPESLIGALVQCVLRDLPKGPIWECACGDGRLVSAMQNAGRVVILLCQKL